jgi:hypothetical protein
MFLRWVLRQDVPQIQMEEMGAVMHPRVPGTE